MSTRRSQALYQKKQALDADGKRCCLVCNGAITAKQRSTFCSSECSDHHYIRTRPDFARLKVFQRDNGICRKCGLDCFAGQKRVRRSAGSGDLWQADHIIPVVEGGGECGLDNLQTLCTACHKAETGALAARRAKSRSRQGNLTLEATA